MNKPDPKVFHQMYGLKKSRVVYLKKDWLDYTLMTLITAALVGWVFGFSSIMAMLGYGLSAFLIVSFSYRHGFELKVPVILRRPQDLLYMLVYKVKNTKPIYWFAIGVLLLENWLIYLTPQWPHKVELMRTLGYYLLFGHFIIISLYRTAIFIAHWNRRPYVKEVLEQTAWKKFMSGSIGFEILHAYATGLLTHMALIMPWYLVITYANFSLLFLIAIVPVNLFTQVKFFKVFNDWFYRDHWLGHNSELEFIYLHGTHHDAIPSGVIGVAGNGHLEGFLRNVLGYPTPFFNPFVAALIYTMEIKRDMDFHQYIPGIFPKVHRGLLNITQHSLHHMGKLEPYGIGMKLDQPGVPEAIIKGTKVFPDELLNSFSLDEQLTGCKWDSAAHRRYQELLDKYHN